MWVNLTLCERGETNREVAVVTLLVATNPGDITRMSDATMALSSNGLVMSTVTRRCYQMVTIAMSEDMMSHKTIATEATAATGSSMTSPMSHYRNGSQDARC
jgi:hypothetical protein